MGRHRALDSVRRGVAKWPLAVLGVVALLALAWLGWSWLDHELDQRAAAQAKSCPQGDSVLRVAVAPSAAGAVDEAAKRWNGQRTVVNDHCVLVEISAREPSQVFAGLSGEWTEAMGGKPQAWLPESTYWVNKLAAANSAMVGSSPESVATSPVVLAVPYEAVKPLETNGSFTFGDLAALTAAPDGWARYGKPEWGRFSLAMPDPASNTASVLALQCAIAGVSPQRAGPVTVDTLTLPAVQQNLAQLAAARPANVPTTTVDALIELGKAGKVQGAPFSAVPVTEVDLYRRNLGLDGQPSQAGKPLYEVAARGPSPAADFPFVALSGAHAQVRAALKFSDFLRETPQQELFNRIGLRAAGGAGYPHDAPGIRWDSATTSLVPADATTTQQISATWANAADGGQVITVLVDVSRSMLANGGGGKSRVDWVKQALHGMTDRMASGSLGVWQFSRRLDADRPYKQLVPTGPVAPNRPTLHAGIDALTPATGTHLYASLDAVYQSAINSYAEGKRNRIVVITDGPNDGGMSYSQLRDRMRDKNIGRGKLPISFLSIGSDLARAELTELARTTGGSVSILTDAAGVDGALGQLLSTDG